MRIKVIKQEISPHKEEIGCKFKFIDGEVNNLTDKLEKEGVDNLRLLIIKF